jgi:opacity protein-like surface antigen
MRLLLLFLLGAASCFSQPFSAGLKAGVPLTDFISTVETGQVNFTTATNRYIIGVGAELHLPAGFGIELDALYRHLNYASVGTSTGLSVVTVSTNATTNAWEFPLMAKYRFPGKIARPFVGAGVAWDSLQGLSQTIRTTIAGTTTTTTTSNPTQLKNNVTTGFVMGVGLDVHALVIHVSPEIRYTRWGAKHFLDPNGGMSSNQNQAEFLVGITF